MANKVVVITGASKGIGAATAKRFARAGYDVVINYLQDRHAAEQTASIIKETGVKVTIIQADVYTEDGIRKLFGQVQKTCEAQTMAQELASERIRCNVVAPGMTKTPHWQTRSEAYRNSASACPCKKSL